MIETKREQARMKQQRRRLGLVRIDNHPSREALAAVNAQRTRYVGGDASSIINHMVLEWTRNRA